MRFGSVCSGIEAASVAWHPLGWQAAWLSEIEPFPSAVLAHHYPDVPNLGDMTTLPERILSGEVEAPDLFCGGTPCQAFSVAGLRNSLDDARGNLSLTFVGIGNAIDHVRSVRSDAPAIIFWENVPGVLSTKDNAFGCFLGALAGEDEPIIPSGEKWTNAGCVYGPQRAVAWRLLDAQYFGVAQRRRRVFVVASARADFDPAKILFEFDSVRRDTAPSREAGKAIASGARTGAAVSSHWDGDYPHPTLNQSAKGSGGVGSSNQEIFSQRGAYLAPQPVAARMVAFGEYVDDGTASAMKARDYKDATDLVAQPIA
jgi:DNA (cytosine-5)-methyltransferase 1